MDNIMLIVDDVELNREILKVLFHSNFRIMEAESGEEALAVLESCQGNIDIVLLDLLMPGISGFELLKMRQNLDYFKDVPVVVITSSDGQQDQIATFDMGASDFIAKPFIPEIVVSRVNNVMASNRRFLSLELEAQKLKIKSEVDGMTGLYNKTTTEYIVNDTLKQCGGRMDVMLIIDIDNFKAVNDTSGHQAGDHVLKIIANLISGQFRRADIVGRVGGDEFCVLMVDVPSMDIVRAKANELIQIMRYKPNLAIPEYVTLSIGIATNEKADCTYTDLFAKADEALYHAKEDGKARYREYGVEPVNMEEDNRSIALLFSNNRSICSSIHALVPECVRVIEVLEYADLSKIKEKDRDKIALAYADVTDYTNNSSIFWEKLRSVPWIAMENVFAICQEGVVSQYMEALKNGIADMFTAPIDSAAFKRRTLHHLERLGVIERKEEPREKIVVMK